jgi:hypothetical protein
VFEVTLFRTGAFTADSTGALVFPRPTVVEGFHLDITAAGLRNALTIDKEIIVWHLLAWSKCSSPIIT